MAVSYTVDSESIVVSVFEVGNKLIKFRQHVYIDIYTIPIHTQQLVQFADVHVSQY